MGKHVTLNLDASKINQHTFQDGVSGICYSPIKHLSISIIYNDYVYPLDIMVP